MPWIELLIAAHVLALGDVWFSRLTVPAKLLWSVTLVFLFGVGLAAWVLTRHTARRSEAPLRE
jgi:hypothetical protein